MKRLFASVFCALLLQGSALATTLQTQIGDISIPTAKEINEQIDSLSKQNDSYSQTIDDLNAQIKALSNEKNKRVRNEFVAELDTEIKVCEEKINDANSQGDQQQKYQLMRLKDKLSIERERVIANSKYI